MALQTSTTTSPTPTSNSDSDPGHDGSTTPLIPAFLIAGVLLAIIAAMFGWRRILRNRHLGVVDFDMDGGVGMPMGGPGNTHGGVFAAGPLVFRMGTRYGVMRGFATREMLEKEVGPKPVLWDVWVEEREKRAERSYKEGRNEGVFEGSKWGRILPLSATIRHSSSDNLSTPAQAHIPYLTETPRVERPFMMRRFFQEPLQSHPPRSKSLPSPSPSQPNNKVRPQLQVAVLIAMPDESTSLQRRLRSNRHHRQSEDSEPASLSSSPSLPEKKEDIEIVSCVRVSEDSNDLARRRGQFALGLADIRCRWTDLQGNLDPDSLKGG